MEYSQGLYQVKRYFTDQPRKGLMLVVCSTMLSGCSSLTTNDESDSLTRVTGAETAQAKQMTTTAPSTVNKTTATTITTAPQSPTLAHTSATQSKASPRAARAASNVVRPQAAKTMPVSKTSEAASATFKKPGTVTAKTVNKTPTKQTVVTKSAPNTVVMTQSPAKPVVVPKTNTAVATAAPNQNTTKKVNSASSTSPSKTATTLAVAELTTPEQINRLIEEKPTAAGKETVAPVTDSVKKPTPIVATNSISKKDISSSNNRQAKLGKYGIWKVEQNWDGEHPGVCRLSTSTRQLDSHDFTAQIWLNVIDDVLLVNTSTNINIKQKGVGIKTNNGKLQRFSKNIYSDSAAWSGSLSKTLKSSNKMEIVVGGSEIGKQNMATSIDLQDLKKAYSVYNDCNG